MAKSARAAVLGVVRKSVFGVALLQFGFATPFAAAESAGGAPALTRANFRDPPTSVRPIYRWWLPLAATSDAQLVAELDEMKRAGAGGVEVAGMPVPAPLNQSADFLRTYGFGSPLWSQRLESIFTAAQARDMKVDFMISAFWPTTTPGVTRLNDPAAQQQMVFGPELVSAGQTRRGPLPAPTTKPASFETTLCAPAKAGDATLRVANSFGHSVGDEISIGEGAQIERAEVSVVQPDRTAICTSLAAPAEAGATRLELTTISVDVRPGVALELVDADGRTLTVAVASVERQGETGGAVTLTTPLAGGFPAGSGIVSGGGRLTLRRPLQADRAAGASVSDVARKTLIAAVVGQCATEVCPARGGTRQLDPSSVTDVTSLVDADQNLTWTAPEGGAPWWVIAFYQTADGQVLEGLAYASPNYVVDHIGAAGASAVTDFYDSTVLTPKLRRLIRSAGDSAVFEDSFEPAPGMKWTAEFVEAFRQNRGYDLVPNLPALAGGGVGALRTFFDFPDTGARVREDYRQTWSELYGSNHMAPYNAWAHSLGLTTRLQVEGGPMQVADLSAYPDVPEGENRNFLNNPELWKVIGIGAILRDQEAVLSTECCPVSGGSWATTAGGPPFTVAQGTGAPFGNSGNDGNLNWIYKAYAGGVNQLIWHGYPYQNAPEGAGSRTGWPGNTFDGNTTFSEAFGPRMPQWRDYRSVNDHLARLQLVLRQGRPRYDVAVFWHDFGVKGLAPNATAFTGYPGLSEQLTTTSSLTGAGYTHQYLSPRYLEAASLSDVQDRSLFSDRAGFKGIVLANQRVMPLESLRRIRTLAIEAKLPLVIVGDPPGRTPGAAEATARDAEVKAIVDELRVAAARAGSNVAFVADEQAVPAALDHLGLKPSVERRSAAGSSDILAVRRRTNDIDYYYLFNQSVDTVRQTLGFEADGAPYELDSWTGDIRALGQFTQGEGRVSLPVEIGANDGKVIAFSRRGIASAPAVRTHALQVTGGEVVARDGALFLRVTEAGSYQAQLSNGRSVQVETVEPTLGALSAWTLQIESWTADETGLPGLAHTRRTLSAPITLQATSEGALPTWSALGHPDKAGIGYYDAYLTLPAEWGALTGAYLDLGVVVDTFRISVNDRDLPPISFQTPSKIDLGPYLHKGSNHIRIEVATPLRNAVEALTKEGAPVLETYGVSGPVIFTPYRDLRLDADN